MANANPVKFQEETKAKVADAKTAAMLRAEDEAKEKPAAPAALPLPPRAKALTLHPLGPTGIKVGVIDY